MSCSGTCMNDVWRLGPKPTGGMGVLVRARSSVDLDDRVWWPLAVAMVLVALGRRVARVQSHACGVVGLHQSSLLLTPCLASRRVSVHMWHANLLLLISQRIYLESTFKVGQSLI